MPKMTVVLSRLVSGTVDVDVPDECPDDTDHEEMAMDEVRKMLDAGDINHDGIDWSECDNNITIDDAYTY